MRPLLAVTLHLVPGYVGQSFDDPLETPKWGRTFQRCYLSSFDSSGIGFVVPGLRTSFQGLLADHIHLSASAHPDAYCKAWSGE